MSSSVQADVLVLGAGAAGLMCAAEAGKRGRKVILLEHADQIGKKILISGGGRCNFTNLHCPPESYLCSNQHFHKSALARYTPEDFIALVERHRVPYHEKTLGQLFCDRSSRDIVNLLQSECDAANVEIVLRCNISEVRHAGSFAVETNHGPYSAPALVVATGGLSIPKMGATPLGYDIARQFGLRLASCRPALVPLTFGGQDLKHFGDLAGIAADVVVRFGTHEFREKMLITHRGWSGPAILQISSYWDGVAPMTLDLLPGRDFGIEVARRRVSGDRSAVKTILSEFVPHRLADRWLRTNVRPNATPEDIDNALHAWNIMPSGTEGYAKAEVTAGGVHLDDLSSKTMEARTVPGLFFIGEVVDVTGHLGGFNFQWAWASGAAAGRAV